MTVVPSLIAVTFPVASTVAICSLSDVQLSLLYPNLFRFGYEIAVILIVLLGIYAAVAGRFEKARPRFRTVCCALGILFIVQELCYLLLAPGQVLTIPGFSPATAAMLAAFALLLCCGLCYPPVREVFPIVEDAEEEDAPSEE